MEKFQNKYRIPSARHPYWDYRWPGAYFITICTQNRVHYFGEINNGKMVLSNVGVIADILWHEIPHHAPNVELGAFVVMPNHVHGILILTGENTDTDNDNVTVETLYATSLPLSQPPTDQSFKPIRSYQNEPMAKISPKPDSVSTIVRSYKSAVTKHAHRLGLEFAWQTRFYDHIIRDTKSFQNITRYIINNPANWRGDKFFENRNL
jgi:REP element-mobilizing transposase RayT